MSLTIDELIKRSYGTAEEKGWWEDIDYLVSFIRSSRLAETEAAKKLEKFVVTAFLSSKLCLMHSEISEALEELRVNDDRTTILHRDGKPEGLAVELADCIIRIADTCGKYSIPLEDALETKLKYNETRPHKHGGKKI